MRETKAAAGRKGKNTAGEGRIPRRYSFEEEIKSSARYRRLAITVH